MLDLANRICDTVKKVTADRASRSCAPQWVVVYDTGGSLVSTMHVGPARRLRRLVTDS
jgi:hypothetical protein